MSKHTNDLIDCPSCDEKLSQAHPKLIDWFKQVVKPSFKDCHVSWSFRDQYNQNQMVAMGKSKLAWPKSKHNFMDENGNPLSLAIDLFELSSNGMASWPWKYFKDISALITDEMEWGGNWKKFPDSDHYELKSDEQKE